MHVRKCCRMSQGYIKSSLSKSMQPSIPPIMSVCHFLSHNVPHSLAHSGDISHVHVTLLCKVGVKINILFHLRFTSFSKSTR